MRPYERLLNYVTYDTASDGNSETCPSTEKQRVFACVLEQEMRSLGLENVRLDGNGYLYGTVPRNIPGCKEAVEDGVSGLLCRPRDTESLYPQLHRMAQLPPARRQAMGRAAHDKMAREFDKQKVVSATISALPTP